MKLGANLGGLGNLSTNYTFVADTWTHIALTRESGTWKFYVDGASQAITGQTGSANSTVAAVAPSDNFYIGDSGWTGGNEHFSGEIDEVRFWSSARTATQIADHYDRQSNGDETGLAGYWNFNEGSGLAAGDETGNSQDLAIVDGPVFKNLTTIPISSGATYKGMILGEDADADGLTYTLASAPEDHNGTFALDGNKYTYINDGDEGDDSFTVTITDEHGETTTETITFNVS